jgi:hypothetical protein
MLNNFLDPNNSMNKIFCCLLFILAIQACKDGTDTHKQSITKVIHRTDSQADSSINFEGHFCFEKKKLEEGTWITLLIQHNIVTGSMNWQPREQHGSVGTLNGVMNQQGELQLTNEFSVEGDHQKEHLIMKLEANQLLIKRGELIVVHGVSTYKDASTATYEDTLVKVNCVY